jgi:hypothetical protein
VKSEDACYSINNTIARVKMRRRKGLLVAVPRLWAAGDKYFDITVSTSQRTLGPFVNC